MPNEVAFIFLAIVLLTALGAGTVGYLLGERAATRRYRDWEDLNRPPEPESRPGRGVRLTTVKIRRNVK